MIAGLPARAEPALASQTTSPLTRSPVTVPSEDSVNSIPSVTLTPVTGPASGTLHTVDPLPELSSVRLPSDAPTYRCPPWKAICPVTAGPTGLDQPILPWAITGLLSTAPPTWARQRLDGDVAPAWNAVTAPLASPMTTRDVLGSSAGEPPAGPASAADQRIWPAFAEIAYSLLFCAPTYTTPR